MKIDFDIIKSLFFDSWKNILIAILLLLLLTSCGIRKVQKSVVKDSLTTEQAKIETKNIAKVEEVKLVINEETNEIEITAIDTAKVLIIAGKTYKNAKVRISNKKFSKAIQKKENFTDKGVTTFKQETKSNKQEVKRNTERKSNPLWNLLWLLIPILLFALYLKYKGKLWWL